MSRLGEYLRFRRRAADLTQQELADIVGCSRSHISKIERGLYDGTKNVSLLKQMFEVLGAEEAEWLVLLV